MNNLNLLTQRQQEIFKLLISNDYVKAKQMVTMFDITLTTLHNDIDMICNCCPKQVTIINSNKGYYISNKELLSKDDYFLADTILYDNQQRFNKILGYLLTHQYTKLLDLEEDLHLERSTIIPYLNYVRREISNKFNIEVLSRPHYGYYLKYNELNYRYCLVFYYTLIKYEINTNNEIFNFLLTYIDDNNIEINDTKFNQLYYWLIVCKNRNKQQQLLNNCSLDLNDNYLEVINNLGINKQDYFIFKQAIELFNTNESLYNYCLSNINIDYKELIIKIKNYLDTYNLTILLDYIDIYNILLKAIIKYKLKIRLNIALNQLDKIIVDSPLSLQLSLHIFKVLKNENIDYDDTDCYELATILYNLIVTRHYLYQPLKLLLVSTLDKKSHDSLKYRLKNRYKEYIDIIDSANFYMISKELVNKYDCVLYFQKDGMLLPNYVKNKCSLDYFVNYNDFSILFEKLIVPHFIFNNPFSKEMLKSIKLKNIDDLNNLYQQYKIVNLSKINDQCRINVIFANYSESIYYSFANPILLQNKQTLVKEKLKEGYIFIIDINNDILSLKMVEHFLRLLYQNKKARIFLQQYQYSDAYSFMLHRRSEFIDE